jgi:hypothetical protein
LPCKSKGNISAGILFQRVTLGALMAVISMKVLVIQNENIEETISEFLIERNRISNYVYDLEKLNQQQKSNIAFKRQLQDIVNVKKNNLSNRLE